MSRGERPTSRRPRAPRGGRASDRGAAQGTVRERIRSVLREAGEAGGLTPGDVSRQARVAERDVAHHLAHLDRSLAHGDEELCMEPARCVACGFVFARRERFARPGQCPVCKARRITRPRFWIARRRG